MLFCAFFHEYLKRTKKNKIYGNHIDKFMYSSYNLVVLKNVPFLFEIRSIFVYCYMANARRCASSIFVPFCKEQKFPKAMLRTRN